jgi:hypothetical protein
MIQPRLHPQRVISDAQLLSPDDVLQGDPRLVHLNEAYCRELMSRDPCVHFVTWPDGALGVVAQTPIDEFREFLMRDAYWRAREALEFLVLYLSSPEANNQAWN